MTKHQFTRAVARYILLFIAAVVLLAALPLLAFADPVLIREGGQKKHQSDLIPFGQWSIISSQVDGTVQACVALAHQGALNCWTLDQSTAAACVRADGALICQPINGVAQ